MSFKPVNAGTLQPQELKTIYEIGRVILQAVDTASALKQIVRLARPVFIFDNVVLYQPREDQSLAPTYARSVGRGRSVEADMDWGETIARDVLQAKDVVLRQEGVAAEHGARMVSRLSSKYFLGLPLWIGDEVQGALVFIRFGGPAYLPEQVNLAKLIAEHIEHLLVRQLLVERVASLEAERKLDRLQQDFVATISHDLRSPLGFIKGYATTLLREDANWDRETRREFLTIIDDETDRLAELIDNLLDSSRLQAGTLPMEFQAVHLETLLRSFDQRIQRGDYNIQVCLDLESSQDTVWADSTRMIQVLGNLLDNAAKYASGSTVTISLRWGPDKAHIRVRDTGPGIPPDQLENVFKRFYRLSEYSDAVKGSGLGLFICRQIIQAHHGEIFAESILGGGTTFHIFLPRQGPPDDSEPSIEEDTL